MFRTSILRAALMASFLLIASSASALETITFDDDSLFHGDTITSVSGNNGSGPIAVFGDNPVDPGMGNWATAFDSNAPTCGDDDLGSPNESCLGGGPGVGADGEPTGANPNCSTLNNVLILQEINCDGGSCSEVCSPGPGSDPSADDSDNKDGVFTLDFSGLGKTVTIHSVDFLDVEADEPNAVAIVLDDAMATLDMTIGDPLGDNGYGTLELGSVPGATFLVIDLNGSGAVDNIVFSYCGDGDVDDGETCDDGNDIDDDDCRNDCTASECGDGIVDDGEDCDDGDDDDTDECRNDCTAPECGDGIVDDGEDCDDGDDRRHRRVPKRLHAPECGDGIVDNGEDCDDGDDRRHRRVPKRLHGS